MPQEFETRPVWGAQNKPFYSALRLLVLPVLRLYAVGRPFCSSRIPVSRIALDRPQARERFGGTQQEDFAVTSESRRARKNAPHGPDWSYRAPCA